jgi:deoxycytidylate deaminase
MYFTTKEAEVYGEFILKIAQYSPAVKRKVAALILHNNDMFIGFNYPIGHDMICESTSNPNETLESVVHAEESAIFNFLKNNKFTDIPIAGRTFYHPVMLCTYTPCYNCCRLIIQAGIRYLYYINMHKTNFTSESELTGFKSPQDFLKEHLIEAEPITI